MRLSELLADLPVDITSSGASSGADPAILAVTDDSRCVSSGTLFIARSGSASDGRAFVSEAIARGAAAVLTDALSALPESARAAVPMAEVRAGASVATIAAVVAERFHGSPSRRLSVVGVTGTNGKTTIAHLVQQILSAAGKRTGLIGTVETDDGATRASSKLTTPGAIELAELFARMVTNGCTHAVMETSSHALAQGRVAAVRFRVGIFTNLTGDHLDYHGTMESYAAAKALLFEGLDADAFAVLNIDDPWSERMRSTKARTIACSLDDPRSECVASIEEVAIDAMRVRFRGPWGTFGIRLPLVGRHNAMNALEAAVCAWTQGVAADVIAAALEGCDAPPGRLQRVTAEGRDDAGFSVLVDYAHTDDALLNVLSALRPVVPTGAALRVVFGCGGDRDRTKRPRMAKVACDLADQVIVTSDNPRTEDPDAIIAEIVAGVPTAARSRVHVEPDREAAIAWAVAQADRGDVVLIAGKGHEDYQIIGTERRAFDDRIAARTALAGRRS